MANVCLDSYVCSGDPFGQAAETSIERGAGSIEVSAKAEFVGERSRAPRGVSIGSASLQSRNNVPGASKMSARNNRDCAYTLLRAL